MPAELLIAIPTVEIQAAAAGTKRPTVSILAYGGGWVTGITGYPLPIAVDLSGLSLPASLPLLVDHVNALGSVAGQAIPTVRGGKLFAEGFLSEAAEAGSRIAAMSREGITFGASIGAMPSKLEKIRGGETIHLNGQTLTAPPGGAYIAREAKLREISLTVYPADDSTAARIAASLKKGNPMPDPTPIITNPEADPNTNPEHDPVLAERTRIKKIEATVSKRDWGAQSKRVADLKEQAIEGTISFEAFQGGLLDAIRAERPDGNYLATGSPHGSNSRGNREILAAATLHFMGLESVAEEAYGERTATEARAIKARTLLDLCEHACRGEHIETSGMGKGEMIRAAVSTYSLPVALGDAANKVLLQAYKESPATWRAFANIRSVANFKEAKAVRPTAFPALDTVPKGGELSHGEIGEKTFTFSADTFGRVLRIDRRDIINDDLSLFHENGTAMGRSASRSLADLIYSVLLANAGSFFASANGNLGEAGSALASGSLSTGVAAMLAQRDEKGFDLDINPRVLLVPPELRDTSLSLLQSEYIAAAEATNLPTGNIHRGALTLAVEPRLSNTDRFGSASTTGWYLFASPQDSGLVVAFLDGKESPVVEFFGMSEDADRLAMSWRVYHDYGAALADPAAAYKATGAAGGE